MRTYWGPRHGNYVCVRHTDWKKTRVDAGDDYLRLLVALEVLIAAERFVAARVVALAHCASHNVDGR